ncbi:MAG: TIGR00341 family protein, partial [Cytophagales bacterium]|nr:TIGR00341 family protein [Cytophaga sp.]
QKELNILYPDLKEYSLGEAVFNHSGSVRKDTITLFVATFRKPISLKEKKKLLYWMKQRIHTDSLKLIIQ